MSIRRIATRSSRRREPDRLHRLRTAGDRPARPRARPRSQGLLVPDQSGVCHTPRRWAPTSSPAASTAVGTPTPSSCEHESHAGGFVASGTETFVGCLGTRCGRFFTTYTFTAKYVGDIEVHGRCHHPIVGGEGDFADVSGVINMHDLPNGCATYKGHLTA